jgi:hypothetical protein
MAPSHPPQRLLSATLIVALPCRNTFDAEINGRTLPPNLSIGKRMGALSGGKSPVVDIS